MTAIRDRSIKLTGYLESKLLESKYFIPLGQVSSRQATFDDSNPGFTIITSPDPSSRGAQLSLMFLPTGSEVMRRVSRGLTSYGVVGDKREPDVIRLAPAPLYNSMEDCERAVGYLEVVLDELRAG